MKKKEYAAPEMVSLTGYCGCGCCGMLEGVKSWHGTFISALAAMVVVP